MKPTNRARIALAATDWPWWAGSLVVAACVAFGGTAWAAAPGAAIAPAPLTLYAAASLTDVLDEVAALYTRQVGRPVRVSFAASSVLARQIEAGARADAFVSADQAWMDYLEQRGLLVAGTRANVARNALVLIAPADSRVVLAIADRFALRTALGDGRLALADPETVPAGRYAKAALQSFDVWTDVSRRIAAADDVRRALAFVARGESPLGVVYETDARREPRVRILDRFPATSHPPIDYPAAALREGDSTAGHFIEFLRGPAAAAIFVRHGFAIAGGR